MKAMVTKPTEVEIHRIRITLPVNYGEEDIPNDFPMRHGDSWDAYVDIDTGEIIGWPDDPRFAECELYMKVCDGGTYRLFHASGGLVASICGDYVPHGVVPGEYGDYVHFKIKSGIITNWPKKPDASAFFRED